MAPTSPQHSVCLIGAGPSGLAALGVFQERGLSVDVFEASDRPGGLWIYDNPNGRSAAYESLQINTSTANMKFRDFDWPQGTPDYPHHRAVAAYLSAYVERKGLADQIQFRREVRSCLPAEGGYRVRILELDTGQEFERFYRSVIVATGHHHEPKIPPVRGLDEFRGHWLHSSAYRHPERPVDLRGKRAVIVGIGNSGVDIACEVSRVAQATYLSVRRGAWVLPKYFRGRPIDQGSVFPRFVPDQLKRALASRGFELLFGSMRDFGLPTPDHNIGEAHPTLSDDLPDLVKSGRIQVRGPIESITGQRAMFGSLPEFVASNDEVDAIIFCTGYQISFPFFDPAHISAPGNHLPLYLRMFHPSERHVYFLGLAQPIGAVLPLVEHQAELLCDHLLGLHELPSREAMLASIAAEEKARRARFVFSERHTMQVDPDDYQSSLESERRRGRIRRKVDP